MDSCNCKGFSNVFRTPGYGLHYYPQMQLLVGFLLWGTLSCARKTCTSWSYFLIQLLCNRAQTQANRETEKSCLLLACTTQLSPLGIQSLPCSNRCLPWLMMIKEDLSNMWWFLEWFLECWSSWNHTARAICFDLWKFFNKVKVLYSTNLSLTYQILIECSSVSGHSEYWEMPWLQDT